MSKPIRPLIPGDFLTSPVWEYATDEEGAEDRDETWVRPLQGQAVPACCYSIVAADFEAACGRRFEGYVFVSTLDGVPDACQGVIMIGSAGFFIANPEVAFYNRMRAESLTGLCLAEHELFPISFRLRVPFEGGRSCWTGVLP